MSGRMSKKARKEASWFEVNRKGLADLVASRGKVFILHELVQNILDCGKATFARIELSPVAGRPLAVLAVEDDDPDGFSDLSHAYTLFAPSAKKVDPSKRGRFNLGEKLVLSLCESAIISSTTGTVHFDEQGRRMTNVRRMAGTRFSAYVRMTKAECEEALVEIRRIMPPSNVSVEINGEKLIRYALFARFDATLPTPKADESEVLRIVRRETSVDLQSPITDEIPMLYELGIPVVELRDGEPWHVNVCQKLPLSMERDNVPPSYMQALHVAMLNAVFHKLTAEQAKAPWVTEAMGHKDVRPEALAVVIRLRFGEKVVISDPSDREGERIAVSQGYTVVAGGAFPASVWSNLKATETLKPAGQVTPSPKPFSPDGDPLAIVPFDDLSADERNFAVWAEEFSREGADLDLKVEFTKDRSWGFNAAHTRIHATACRIVFNIGRLGRAWCRSANWRDQVRLLIHELGHQWGHHLESSYHEALCRLGSAAMEYAIKNSHRFPRGD